MQFNKIQLNMQFNKKINYTGGLVKLSKFKFKSNYKSSSIYKKIFKYNTATRSDFKSRDLKISKF